VGRHRDLLRAIIDAARVVDLSIQVRAQPEEPDFPVVLDYQFASEPEPRGFIIVFPSNDLVLTSNHLGLVAEYIKHAREIGGKTVLLFCEDAYPKVKGVIGAANLEKFAEIGTYAKNEHRFGVDYDFSNLLMKSSQ
jgi:hypothetical protein